jgi:hypothetical protein
MDAASLKPLPHRYSRAFSWPNLEISQRYGQSARRQTIQPIVCTPSMGFMQNAG